MPSLKVSNAPTLAAFRRADCQLGTAADIFALLGISQHLGQFVNDCEESADEFAFLEQWHRKNPDAPVAELAKTTAGIIDSGICWADHDYPWESIFDELMARES